MDRRTDGADGKKLLVRRCPCAKTCFNLLERHLLLEGGKACGQASVMLHWDDDSPVRRAMTGYVHGRRAKPAISVNVLASCPQTCVHGICELGTCKCWKGVPH